MLERRHVAFVRVCVWWWWFGGGRSFVTNIQVCSEHTKRHALYLLSYQSFNLIGPALLVDFIYPYFFLEYEKANPLPAPLSLF